MHSGLDLLKGGSKEEKSFLLILSGGARGMDGAWSVRHIGIASHLNSMLEREDDLDVGKLCTIQS